MTTKYPPLPWLPDPPGRLPEYPTIFARTSFGSTTPHLDDLDHWRALTADSAKYRLHERARRAPEFVLSGPSYPDLPREAERALKVVTEGRLAETFHPPDPAKFSLPPPRFSEQFLLALSRTRREQRSREAGRLDRNFRHACAAHVKEVHDAEQMAAAASSFLRERERRIRAWVAAEQTWKQWADADRSRWDVLLKGYSSGSPAGIEAYFQQVLGVIPHPAWLPVQCELHHDLDNQVLLLDCRLPDPSAMEVERTRVLKKGPSKTSARKVEAREFKESVLYFAVLRLMWEIAHADVERRVKLVCTNGNVTRPDPATGVRRTDTIMSVAGRPDELCSIRLERVDPAACFRALKGVSGARVTELVPIRPIIAFDRDDARFVQGREVLVTSAGENLAAMDWQAFEHLIRELFEKEYAANGAEVRVTRASRDRGVDAIIFDPDPLRGGKYVVQAKRYTRTVDVAAVRELYGTVQAEGANKGILVTTSTYGRDAYEFAKDKPLTLLTGSNLLSLLERHGYGNLRIDLAEARKLVGQPSAG